MGTYMTKYIPEMYVDAPVLKMSSQSIILEYKLDVVQLRLHVLFANMCN